MARDADAEPFLPLLGGLVSSLFSGRKGKRDVVDSASISQLYARTADAEPYLPFVAPLLEEVTKRNVKRDLIERDVAELWERAADAESYHDLATREPLMVSFCRDPGMVLLVCELCR